MSKKIFVGSLPSDITDGGLRAEFGKYGMVEETFVKPGCDPGRQWAFVTFATPDQAARAKESCDRILIFPGCDRPCDVMPAKNQGMFGQGNLDGGGGGGGQGGMYGMQSSYQAPVQQGPRKIFVGSLPDSINEQVLREEFSRYGQIVDVFLKQGCESGRQWAFVTYNSNAEAQSAKDATDRILVVPGADRACEVMLAKNQGKFGQEAMSSGGAPGQAAQQLGGFGGGGFGDGCAAACGGFGGGCAGFAGYPQQQLAPQLAPQLGASQWKTYRTASGLPYYHNHATGQTQWDMPPELGGGMPLQCAAPAPQMAPQMGGYAAYGVGGVGGAAGYAVPGQARYSPY